MAKQTINVGTTANDKKGDSLRAAFQKVNANFTELYTALGLNSDGTLNLGAFEFLGSTMSTTDSTAITIDQAVTVSSDLTVGGDILPSVADGGNLGSLDKPFKSLYVSDQTVFFGGVPLSLDPVTSELKVNNVPISQTITYTDIPNVPTDVSDLTDTGGLLGGGGGAANTGDITFAATTISAPNEDEIVIQSKDSNGFGTARFTLNSEYGGDARLRAFSSESVDTFTLANGDFATGVWRDNGFGNGIVEFTGAQGIGDFFQNTLFKLTADNVTISINSGTPFVWNGGASGAGTDTPGFGTNPTVPANPITIISIQFRYRSESFISVNYDNQEIRLNVQNGGITFDANNTIQMFGDSNIELQSGENFSISSGQDISISTASSDTVSISTGDLNITAYDDVNFRGSDSFRIRNSSATAPIRIITDDANTEKTWAFNPSGNLTLPGNLQSESDISIEINLTDSTRRIWRFGEDGELTFPDGTAQNSAGISASSTDTLTNKTINIQAGQGNVFQIQGNSISSYSGSGAVLALTSMPTFFGMNVNNSSLSIDGGSGSYYWAPTFADGTGTIHKAGVYKSAADANNSLFSFGANGAGTMSVVMDGSLFVGSSLPSNNGGLNTDYGGWLVVQAGAKFGGDLNTIGNFILDTPGNYVRFGDGTTQTTAADFGYLDLDKDTIKGTAGYQYTFATDGYFTSSTSSESTNYFFVAYNTTNANIAAGWTVVGGTANTTVSSVTYPVAGYPGVIRVNLTAAASSTSGFYPVTVTSPDRLRVEIQPNPSTSDKFAFTTSGLTFPDATVQTTAYTGTANLATVARNIESEGDVSIRVNLTDSTQRVWQFGEDGELTLPNGSVIRETEVTGNPTIELEPADALDPSQKLLIKGGQAEEPHLHLTSGDLRETSIFLGTDEHNVRTRQGGDIEITTRNYSNDGSYVWTFDNNGTLLLPNDTAIGDDDNNGIAVTMPITSGSTNSFSWRFSDVVSGVNDTITLNYNLLGTNQSDWYFAVNNNTAPKYLYLDGATQSLTMLTGALTNNGKLIFGTAAGNNAGDANAIELKATDGDVYLTSTESVTITVDADDSSVRVWRFDPTGVLTLPEGGDIVDSTGTSVLGGGGSGSVLEEPFESKTSATGVIEHDATTNRLFRHTSISANFTANFTNLGLTAGKATSISLVLVQGATARMCTAVQIGGAAQTITWQGSASAPLGNANRTDVVTFSILCTATDTYTVLGMLTSFGG